MKWIKKWNIEKSSGDGFWVVAIDKDNNWGCSCPVWKFKRQECKHIQYVKTHPSISPEKEISIKLPDLAPANVETPIFNKKKNIIFYPLVPLDGNGVWMEATICWFLMEHGFSFSVVKERRHLPNQWTKQAIYEYIEHYGIAKYVNINDPCDVRMAKVS